MTPMDLDLPVDVREFDDANNKLRKRVSVQPAGRALGGC
jgi:hypothetical protein